MAVGGGNNPHTTEKQLVCEGAVFVSIYPVLVYFHYSLNSEAILLFPPPFFFFFIVDLFLSSTSVAKDWAFISVWYRDMVT